MSTKNIISSPFGMRVEKVIQEKGINKTWLSSKIGITKQGLNSLLRRENPSYTCELSELLNVNRLWLETGKGPIELSISLEILNGNDLQPEGRSVLVNNTDEINMFAYRLESSAMEPSFPQGCILLLEKDMKPKNKDFVLIRTEDKHIIFRQFFMDAAEIILKPINKEYETIKTTKCDVIGVLIEARITMSDFVQKA